MKDTFIVLNQMHAAGVIGRYAIGGAVGATFYLEPVATLDVDGLRAALSGRQQPAAHPRTGV